MSKSTPKPPDYTAAAEASGQSSRENTEAQTWANRPNQTTPWGTTSWSNTPTWDPSTQQYVNKWQQDTTLNEQSQRALDAQLALTTGRSELGASLFPRMKDEFGQEMDWSKFQQGGQGVQAPGQVEGGPLATAPEAPTYDTSTLGPQGQVGQEQLKRDYELMGPELDSSQKYYQNANDAIYNQWADRALPQQEEARNQLQTRLYNMGLKEGDQAYDREMEKLGQQQSDAMQQAQYQATIGAGSEAQRMLGMDASTRQQLTGEQAALAGFGNEAALGAFGMGMQGAQLTDAQRAQRAQEMLQFGQAGFQNQLAGAGFQNQAQGQDFSQRMASGQQGFNQQMQADQYATQLRQQQIAEEMQRRGWSLNEANALISGQQVNMPTMPGFNTATKSDTVDYLGAAGKQWDASQDVYGMKQAQTQQMIDAASGIGGAFMGFSDRRLKRNIERIASVGGVNIYKFEYIWGEKSVGVMADEVPHAIAGTINGFSVVDYRRVW